MSLATDNIFLNADKGRITQVLSNLLDNALKFTTEGSINITTKRVKDNQEVMVSIKDNGTGIYSLSNISRII